MANGAGERRDPHILFDSNYYLDTYPDTADCENLLVHYLEIGSQRNYSPHWLFDPSWYLSQTDDPEARAAPLQHYLAKGGAADLSPHPFFDTGWYRGTQMRTQEGLDPLCHFLSREEREGCDPNPLFDTAWYRERHPDVTKDGWNALFHYMRHGAAEGRSPHPSLCPELYVRRWPEAAPPGNSPLMHALIRQRLSDQHTSANLIRACETVLKAGSAGGDEIPNRPNDMGRGRSGLAQARAPKGELSEASSQKRMLEVTAVMDRLGIRRFVGEGWAGSRNEVLLLRRLFRTCGRARYRERT